MSGTDVIDRFTQRAAGYAAHRWDYEPQAIDRLLAITGLQPGAPVADVGAGTGMLTEHLLQRGLRVYAVEPGSGMRAIAEAQLAHYGGFTSINGLAEATGLPDEAVALITAGRALHWFPREAARAEFLRILRPGGWLAVVGVKWLASPLRDAFNATLRTPEYGWRPKPSTEPEALRWYFGGNDSEYHSFPGEWTETRPEFLGRLSSMSVSPNEGSEEYERSRRAAGDLFDRFASDGRVVSPAATTLIVGKIKP